jgi:hypothetical protein
MDKSIFTDKEKPPTNNDLIDALGNTYHLWQMIKDYALLKCTESIDEWKYSGDKYGWSFRIKDKKRVICYMLPRGKFFKVAFVYGQKATDKVMKSRVTDAIKMELASARVYAEGRGIRIDMKDNTIINDIKELIKIKLAN